MSELWEQLPEEPDDAWGAFKSYRDQGPNRVFRHIPVNLPILSAWRKRYRWKERVEAWDQLTSEATRQEFEDAVKAAVRDGQGRHTRALNMTLELVERELGKFNQASRENEGLGLVKPSEIQKLLEMAIKLQRLIQGQTTENVGTPDLDTTRLSPEEVLELQRLLEKAGMQVEAD